MLSYLYPHCAANCRKLDEELGDLATFEDQYADDGSKGRKLGEYDLVGDVQDHCIVDAGQEDLGWSLI